ncbi:MAG: S-adenosylmethionine:tRNA ribosyltransferase-isomerase [Nannocystaceae bacterium]|nr:S-adenosylmethionine:tRNA ribosyltransferase-isomerase [Nannocystaceae bacterium]
MKARATPHKGGDRQRLLVIDPAGDAIVERTVGALPQLLRAGDRVVVNDAATMPASLAVRAASRDARLELRFAGPPTHGRWPAVLMGPGDWHTDTDRREPPPVLLVGDALAIEGGGRLEVVAVDPYAPRLLEVAFDRDQAQAWALLLRHGRPVQYAYLDRDVELAEVQTSYAGRPWSVEMPSAGRPLTIATLLALRAAGIGVSRLTHAAGLSATGDASLDRRLPLPERYALPQTTVDEIARSRDAGGRIVAVGTSVVRALEGNARAHGGRLRAGEFVTDHRLGPGVTLLQVDGVLSGVHEPGSSHHALLSAFAPATLLERAHAYALSHELAIHEFGDSTLVLRGAAEPVVRSLSAAA